MSHEWISKAPCRGLTDLFFPVRFRTSSRIIFDEAREICGGCPYRGPCLQIALSVDEEVDRWGMFGGMDPFERYLARRGEKALPRNYGEEVR